MNTNVIDTVYLHVINLILSLAVIIVLISLYIKKHKTIDSFGSNMIFLPLVAALHVTVFSIVLIIDHLDGVVNYPTVYNIWAIFLLMEILVTKLWLSVLAWIKYNKGGQKQ